MVTWFGALSTLEKVFAILAALGGGLFAFRVILSFVGMGDTQDAGDFDHGGGVDMADTDHAVVHDLHDMMSFKLLSFQGLTAFFMMFGLVGLAISRAQLGSLNALLGGGLAGLALVWVSDKLFRAFGKLQHKGNADLTMAIGQEGTIYLGIPAGETGKVRLTVQGRMKVLDAVSDDKEPIPTSTRVRVVNVVNERIMVVKAI